MITPLDIDNKQFTKQFKGYDATEVDIFLDEVSADYDKIMRDNVQMKNKIESLEKELEKYKGIENTLQETLVIAKGTADNMIEIARKEAKQIIDNAKVDTEEKIRQANQELIQRNMDLEDLKKEVNIYKAKVENTMLTVLEMLKDIGETEN